MKHKIISVPNFQYKVENTKAHEKRSFLDRHQVQWEYIQQQIFPNLIKANITSKSLKFADLGASTFEETARIFYEAIKALEVANQNTDEWNITILAYDIDEAMIEEGEKRIDGEEAFISQGNKYADAIMDCLEKHAQKFRASVYGIVEDIKYISKHDLDNTDIILINHVLRNFNNKKECSDFIREISKKAPNSVIAIGDHNKMWTEWTSELTKGHYFIDPYLYEKESKYMFFMPN